MLDVRHKTREIQDTGQKYKMLGVKNTFEKDLKTKQK